MVFKWGKDWEWSKWEYQGRFYFGNDFGLGCRLNMNDMFEHVFSVVFLCWVWEWERRLRFIGTKTKEENE